MAMGTIFAPFEIQNTEMTEWHFSMRFWGMQNHFTNNSM
jgi:hypothetical protein